MSRSRLNAESASSVGGVPDSTTILHGLLAGSRDLIAAVDRQGRFLALSSRLQAEFRKLYGVEVTVGDRLATALAALPLQQAAVQQLWDRALQGEEFTVEEDFGDPQRGRWRYELSFNRFCDQQGEQVGAFVIARDVTARHAARQQLADLNSQLEGHIDSRTAHLEKALSELRQSEAEYRLMFELAAVGKAESNVATRRVTRANRKFCEMLGYTCEELIGKTFLEVTHPDDRQATIDGVRRLVSGEIDELVLEKRYLRKDGSTLHAAINSAVVRDERGEPRRIVSVVQDIEDRSHAQQLLQQTNRRLELLSQASRELLLADDPLEFLDQLFQRMSVHLGLEVYFHYELEPGGQTLRLAAYSGAPQESLPELEKLKLGEAFCGTVALQRQPIVCEDVQHSTDPRARLIRQYGVTAYACYPLLARGQLIGTLSFGTRDGTQFDEHSLALIRSMCDQVAAALERKQTERALRESEQRYRQLLHGGRDGVQVYELDEQNHYGRFVEVNDEACRQLGYTREEMLQLSLADITTTPGETLQAEMTRLAASGEAIFEAEFRTREGRSFPVEISARTTTLDGRRCVVAFVRDVTERRQAELAVHESAARIKAIVETAVDGIITIDERGQIESTNPAAERIFGYTAQEMLGNNISMLMPPPYSGEHDRYLQQYLLTGEAKIIGHGREVRGRRKNGAEFPLELAVSEMWLNGRRLFTGIVRDVSDRMRAHAALRLANERTEQSLAQLEAIIGHMTDGLVVADPQGNLLQMNPSALALHGFASQEEAERPLQDFTALFELYDLDGHKMALEDWPLSRALRGETFAALEVRVLHKGTGRSWIGSIGGTAVRDKDGRVKLAILTLRDVTDKKQSEEQLWQLNETLEQRVVERTALLKMRNEQLRMLASKLTAAENQERRRIAQLLHDHFQQLLVAAKIGVEQLRKGNLDGRQTAITGNINDIIDQSIQASRTLAVELCPPVLYDRGLAAALEWLSRQFQEQHGLEVQVEVDHDAEPAESDLQAFLLQAVRELLLNVVKHARINQARVRMQCGPDGSVQLSVEDEGPGFDPKEGFASPDEDHGFGLFSIQQRLALLGGSFAIDTEPGRGCRVTLVAPRDAAAALDLTAATAPRRAARQAREEGSRRAPAAARTIRLLLVDDHKIMRQGLARLLSTEADIELLGEAADGLEAVALARQFQPDVVVMDVSMPHMDGITATRQILTHAPQTRIIGLSMHEQDDMAAAMLDAGAAVYLTKGGPSEALFDAIRGDSQ